MSTQLVIRIDPDLKEKASHFAAREGRSLSEVVRALLENYTRERDMTGYVDDLWARIGRKLADKDTTPADIERVIEEVRADNGQGRR